jgi:AcrR family transcriptional regulator
MKSSTVPSRRTARRAQRKVPRRGVITDALILDAAEPLFAQYGFEGVSNRQLAAAAGVTIGAIYHYFPSKQAIYDAVRHRAFSEKFVLPEIVSDESADPRNRLRASIAWFVEVMTSNRTLGQLVQRELLEPHSANPAELLEAHFNQAYQLTRQLLKAIFPRVNQDEAFSTLLALSFGFANLKGVYTLAPTIRTSLDSPEKIAHHILVLLAKTCE